MPPVPLSHDTLTIRPWADRVIDQIGHDPRGAYVERFWLPLLGPTATLSLRRLADRFDVHPDGCEVDLVELAHEVGLGGRSDRNAPLNRALTRLCQFRHAQPMVIRDGVAHGLAVRRRLPPLTRKQARRLPESLRSGHEARVAGHPAVTPVHRAVG